jgi:hypothetical protein
MPRRQCQLPYRLMDPIKGRLGNHPAWQTLKACHIRAVHAQPRHPPPAAMHGNRTGRRAALPCQPGRKTTGTAPSCRNNARTQAQDAGRGGSGCWGVGRGSCSHLGDEASLAACGQRRRQRRRRSSSVPRAPLGLQHRSRRRRCRYRRMWRTAIAGRRCWGLRHCFLLRCCGWVLLPGGRRHCTLSCWSAAASRPHVQLHAGIRRRRCNRCHCGVRSGAARAGWGGDAAPEPFLGAGGGSGGGNGIPCSDGGGGCGGTAQPAGAATAAAAASAPVSSGFAGGTCRFNLADARATQHRSHVLRVHILGQEAAVPAQQQSQKVAHPMRALQCGALQACFEAMRPEAPSVSKLACLSSNHAATAAAAVPPRMWQ